MFYCLSVYDTDKIRIMFNFYVAYLNHVIGICKLLHQAIHLTRWTNSSMVYCFSFKWGES